MHTQGPWYVVVTQDAVEIATSADGAGESVLALLYDNDQQSYYGAPYHGDDRIDNARLIAAAPELLDVLEHIVETADAAWDNADRLFSDGRLDSQTPGDKAQAIARMARAAIVQAKGEE